MVSQGEAFTTDAPKSQQKDMKITASSCFQIHSSLHTTYLLTTSSSPAELSTSLAAPCVESRNSLFFSLYIMVISLVLSTDRELPKQVGMSVECELQDLTLTGPNHERCLIRSGVKNFPSFLPKCPGPRLTLMEDQMLLGNLMYGGMALCVRKQKKIQPKILRENGDLS